MALNFRSGWQKFKKDHPNFEKSKKFKSDFGPNLEKWEKAVGNANKATEALVAAYEELVNAAKTASQISAGYKAVASELKSSDRRIEQDFDDLFNYMVRSSFPVIIHVGRIQAFDKSLQDLLK